MYRIVHFCAEFASAHTHTLAGSAIAMRTVRRTNILTMIIIIEAGEAVARRDGLAATNRSICHAVRSLNDLINSRDVIIAIV